MRRIITSLSVVFIFVTMETTVSPQQGMGQFSGFSFGCKTAEKAAKLDWLETKNKPQFLQELKNCTSTGDCGSFNHGDGYEGCDMPDRLIDGSTVTKIKSLNDNKEYWVPIGKGVQQYEMNGVFRRSSFGCAFEGDAQHLAWLQKVNNTQFETDLRNFISTGQCRSFSTTDSILGGRGDELLLRGTALVRIGRKDTGWWWVPSKDITGVMQKAPVR